MTAYSDVQTLVADLNAGRRARTVAAQKKVDRVMKTTEGRKDAVREVLLAFHEVSPLDYSGQPSYVSTWDVRKAVEASTGHALTEGQIHGAMAKLGSSVERKTRTTSTTSYRVREQDR